MGWSGLCLLREGARPRGSKPVIRLSYSLSALAALSGGSVPAGVVVGVMVAGVQAPRRFNWAGARRELAWQDDPAAFPPLGKLFGHVRVVRFDVADQAGQKALRLEPSA